MWYRSFWRVKSTSRSGLQCFIQPEKAGDTMILTDFWGLYKSFLDKPYPLPKITTSSKNWRTLSIQQNWTYLWDIAIVCHLMCICRTYLIQYSHGEKLKCKNYNEYICHDTRHIPEGNKSPIKGPGLHHCLYQYYPHHTTKRPCVRLELLTTTGNWFRRSLEKWIQS